MSQKSTKFDEFASLFRSVVRPHLEVDPLPLSKLLVIVDIHSDDEKFHGLCKVAESMVETFRPRVRLFCPVETEVELLEAQKRLDILVRGFAGKDVEFETETKVCLASGAILAEVAGFGADFLLLPNLFGERDRDLEGYTLGAVVDKVLSKSGIPILLIEGDVVDASLLWQDMLLFIEETQTAETCLAATRTLASKAAEARMLHVIDQHMLDIVARAFSVTTELETGLAQESLVAALRKDMVHFLEGGKELLDRTGHKASYEIVVGDPVEATRRFINENGPHLVVCNSVAPDERLVDSVAYNLAVYLREVPLLLV